MDIAYTPKDLALDALAIALICMPEPVTTPIGISILCRKRGNGAQTGSKHLHNYPEYVYKVDTIRGREITWEARTLRPGQLPMHSLNKPDIKFKEREEYIKGRKLPGQSSAKTAIDNKLQPGVNVHHTLIKPPPPIRQTRPLYSVGETMHHTLREIPKPVPAIKRDVPQTIHHSLENSAAYLNIRRNADQPQQQQVIHHSLMELPALRIDKPQQQQIIHHSIDQSLVAHNNNPVKIERPVIIRQHHTLNTKPVNTADNLVIPPPPMRRRNNID